MEDGQSSKKRLLKTDMSPVFFKVLLFLIVTYLFPLPVWSDFPNTQIDDNTDFCFICTCPTENGLIQMHFYSQLKCHNMEIPDSDVLQMAQVECLRVRNAKWGTLGSLFDYFLTEEDKQALAQISCKLSQ